MTDVKSLWDSIEGRATRDCQVTFRACGFKIRVSCDSAENLLSAAGYCRDYLSILAELGGVPELLFSGDPHVRRALAMILGAAPSATADGFRLTPDGHYYVASHVDEDDSCLISYVLLRPETGRVIVAYAGEHPRATRTLVRIIRAAFVTAYFRAGYRFWHAAAATFGDRAIGIIGERAAGKTSTLLTLASTGLFGIMSNDLVAWRRDESGVFLIGVPMSAGVRLGLLTARPDLRKVLVGDDEVFSELGRTLQVSPDAKIGIPIHEIAKQLGAVVRPSAYATMVLAPQYDSRARTARLLPVSKRECGVLLRRHELSAIQDVLPMQTFFAPLAQSGAIDSLPPDSIPMFWLVQNERTAADSVRLVTQACEHAASSIER